MTDDDGATVRQWTDVVRRARLGRTTKLVALLLANYADSDGSRVFPGIARVSIEAELTYNVVQSAMATLRRVGLIRVVRQAARRGESDEYRLVMAPDLLEHVSVLSPAEVSKHIEETRTERRGKVRAPGPESPEPHPTKPGAASTDLHPTANGARPEAAPHGVWSKTRPAPHGVVSRTPRRSPPPTTTETQELPTTPTTDLRTDVTVVARDLAEDQAHRLSSKCSHGLAARLLPDGNSSCALCRHEARLADPNVIPIWRNA